FAAGMAQAGAFPSVTGALRGWIPPARRALATGMLTGCMSLGGAVSASLAGLLLGHFNWRVIFVLFALPGLAWAAAFFYWFRDSPDEHPQTNAAERAWIEAGRLEDPSSNSRKHAARAVWISIITSGSMWVICTQQFLRAAAYIFFATWFTS